MLIKQALVAIAVMCVLAVLICSCSDNSMVGTQEGKRESADALRTCGPGAVGSGMSSRVYVFALDGEERSIAVRIYDSITDIDFPLSIQQMEMIGAGGIVEISAPDAVSDIVRSIFGSQLSPEQGTICTIGILYTDREILGVSWSCLKHCASASNYDECIRRCESKIKDDGRSIYFTY
jgi:hypothetical protein